MSKSQIGLRKAGIASIATTALVCTSVFTAGSASALPGFEFDRIGGSDRYETSALVAAEYGNSTNAILANGEPGNFADALAANTLAGELDAPVLLTRVNQTPDSVLTALEERGVETITVAGGESRVSAAQVAALRNAGYTVNRESGDDRFLTNAEIIEASGPAEGGIGLIANGFGFADALSAGPIAFQGHPLGLSSADDIDDDVIAALKGAGVDQVLVFGGATAVGPAVVAKLAANDITLLQRFAGADRTETSTLAADWAIANLGFTDEAVNIATGAPTSFGADALSGGPLTGQQMRALLLTNNADEPRDVLNWVEENNDTLVEGIIFGGNAAISVQLQEQLEDAAQGEEPEPEPEPEPTTNQDFTVETGDAQTLELADDEDVNGPDTDATDNRRFVVDGLEDGTTYDVVLVPADRVTVDENGVATFRDNEGTNNVGNNQADVPATTDIARFVAANSAPVDADRITVSPVNGTVNFTIDGTAPGTVYPVIFNDANGNDAIDLNADNQPTEDFGVGGATTFTAPELGGGAFTGGVTEVNKDSNTFVIGEGANAATVNYDANDNYTVDGTPSTLAQFEAALSSGDGVSGSYAPDPEASSTFELDDNNPGTPNVDAAVVGNTAENFNDVEVSVDIPADADATDSVVIERANVNAQGAAGAYTVIATEEPTAAEYAADEVTYVDEDLAEGTYRYRAALVNDGDQGDYGVSNDDVVVGAPAADDELPVVDTLVVDQGANEGNDADEVDAGDQIRLGFSEAVTVADGASIWLRDSDGTVASLTDGENADFVQSTNGEVLFVTVTGAPERQVVGSGIDALTLEDDGLAVVNSAGIADTTGNDLAEVFADVEEAVAGEDTFTVNFTNGPVDESTVTAGDFIVEDGNSVASVDVAADGGSATVTLDQPLAAGDEYGITGDSVENVYGGNGPAADVVDAALADADGDGVPANVDPDDNDPNVTGVDEDNDGVDAAVDPDDNDPNVTSNADPSAAASSATAADNGDGTATITAIVEDFDGAAITGLTLADFAAPGGVGTLTAATETATPGTYELEYTAVDGTYTVDVSAQDVVIQEDLSVPVTSTP